jgi:hypothetical protein
MTRHLAWLAVLLVGGTALAVLPASLAFVPVNRWEAYVPIVAIVCTVGLIVAGVTVETAGELLVRPMRRPVRSIEQDA